MAQFKTWFLETRPQFLLLSVVLVFLGTCIAWYDGSFHFWHAVLAFVGLLLAHIGVNVLNDYFDYKSGIDLKTKRTPFSGGSGVLPAAMMKPGQVFWLGMVSFLLAIPVGIYFVVVQGWQLLPLLIVGGLCVILYTPVLTRIGWPEWAPGAGMGALPVLGAYFIQTGDYTLPAVIACIPSGILVHNLLLINEFPDFTADKWAGRRTLPITIGKKGAAIVYSVLTVAVYAWIVGAVIYSWVISGVPNGPIPAFSLIALLTLPLAIKAIKGALNPDDMSKLVPAMSNNVLVVLGTQLLLGVGYILGRVF